MTRVDEHDPTALGGLQRILKLDPFYGRRGAPMATLVLSILRQEQIIWSLVRAVTGKKQDDRVFWARIAEQFKRVYDIGPCRRTNASGHQQLDLYVRVQGAAS